MKKYILFVAILAFTTACSTLSDTNVEQAVKVNSDIKQSMDHENRSFVARKGLSDGYEIIFHVMQAPEGEGFSRKNYHLMVSIEKNGVPMDDLTVYSDVKHPDGSSQAKQPMMQMGHWYMALYNLSHEQGRHWITISFDESERTYTSGVYYPERIIR